MTRAKVPQVAVPLIAAAAILTVLAAQATAHSVSMLTFTNLSNQLLAPVVVVVHGHGGGIAEATADSAMSSSSSSVMPSAGAAMDVVFTPGMPASEELADLAEAGSPDMLVNALSRDLRVTSTVVLRGRNTKIFPGESVEVEIEAASGQMVTLVGMLASTNDGFAGVRNLQVPYYGSVETYVAAYDAGSETNTEMCSDIPGPPCSADSGNMRVTEGAEGFVYVHPGIRGDAEITLDRDWRNPVARVVVTGPSGR